MSAERIRSQNVTYSDLQNPLFIHPSDRPASLAISEKLVGAKNYRTWRRLVEIGLSTKRKLAFVQRTLPRPIDDVAKTEQWDACNNLVIAWLMNAVFDTIARSILYVQSAREVWIQLEKRFCLSNGSGKYSLNKEVYAMKQDSISMSEYYTKMKCIWEELDSMIELPQFTQTNDEINAFLRALTKQQEE